MRKRRIYAIQIALSLVIVCGLATSCGMLASKYPADISGHVAIAETVKAKYQSGQHAGETMEMTPLEGQIYWIIDISVKNKSYENEVTANNTHWEIIVDGQVYDAQGPFLSIQSAYPMTVPMGETGETTIRFPVPDTLEVSSAQLCYQGQEPYSYGNLSGGNIVAVYDWDLRTVVTKVVTPPIEPKIADARIIGTSNVRLSNIFSQTQGNPYSVIVKLTPTDAARAGHEYVVELYEGNKLRGSTVATWNQPEINVHKSILVSFYVLTKEEYDAYSGQDINHIFTIKIHE